MSSKETSTWENSLRCVEALTEGNTGAILLWAIVAALLWIAHIHQQRRLATTEDPSSARSERSRLRERLNNTDDEGAGDMSSDMHAAMAMRFSMGIGGARIVEGQNSSTPTNGGDAANASDPSNGSNVAEEKRVLRTDAWSRFVYAPVSTNDDDVADVEAPLEDASKISDEASADGSANPLTEVDEVVSFNSPRSTACLAFERYGILVDSDDINNLALTLDELERGEAEVTLPIRETTSLQKTQQPDYDDAGRTKTGQGSPHTLTTERRQQQRNLQQGDTSECSICLQEYESGDVLVQLPCNHAYHDECVALWVSRNVRCPLCNYDLECSDSEDEPLDA